MQKEFQALLDEIAALLPAYFSDRFISGYLHGSVYYGDAIPGVSDLDYMVILTNLTEADKAWLRQTARELERLFPVAAEVHLNTCTLDELRSQSFTRFALTYNATLHAGQDALAMLTSEGITAPSPNAAFAKARLDFARQCFQQALMGETPACTGPLPTETPFILRKFARYFVVIEGAYFLMCRDLFCGFRTVDVLPALMNGCLEYRDMLLLTEAILSAPENQILTPDEYLCRIQPLVMWMFAQIENTNQNNLFKVLIEK